MCSLLPADPVMTKSGAIAGQGAAAGVVGAAQGGQSQGWSDLSVAGYSIGSTVVASAVAAVFYYIRYITLGK